MKLRFVFGLGLWLSLCWPACADHIAFYFGTFDPPHAGHLALVQAAQKELHLDRVYILPNYTPGPTENRIVAVMPREGYAIQWLPEVKAAQQRGQLYELKTKVKGLSSSWVRQQVQQGHWEVLKDLIDPEIQWYIRQQRLYSVVTKRVQLSRTPLQIKSKVMSRW